MSETRFDYAVFRYAKKDYILLTDVIDLLRSIEYLELFGDVPLDKGRLADHFERIMDEAKDGEQPVVKDEEAFT